MEVLSTCAKIIPTQISYEQFKMIYTVLDAIGDNPGLSSVYKAVDNITNEVCAIKFTVDFTSDAKLEVEKICKIDDLMRQYSECYIKIKHFGKVSNEIISDIDLYWDEDDLSETQADNVFFFSTDLYLGFSDIFDAYMDTLVLQSNTDLSDILFELSYTIILLNFKFNIFHGDLHPGNIVLKKVSNKRQYTINEEIYIVTSHYIPIIIDWAIPPVGVKPHYPTDLEFLFETMKLLSRHEFIQYPHDLVTSYREGSPDVLFSEIFNYLKHNTIEGGDMVTIFEPVTI
jgi:hypothetical protein